MRRWVWAVLAAGAAAAVATRPFRVEVAGRSMAPTLLPGDWLVATRRGRIRRGSVVVLRDPQGGLDMVKRVAALPGDEVEGRPLAPGRYLVLGDDPRASTDGRSFGPVDGSSIDGVVRFRYWPRPGSVRR
jgi:signal peptidase I